MQVKQEITFSTQATILKMLGIEYDKGKCSSYTNLYASSQIGNGSREFLNGSPEKAYADAIKMEKHQDDVTQQVSTSHGKSFGNLIGLHVSFFDNQKKFKGENVSVKKLTTTTGAKDAFQDSEHVLITYPIDAGQSKASPYHQVYYGHRAGTNKCTYFNANLAGGEREGSCDEVLKILVDDIVSSAADDGRTCIVGRTI